MVRSGVLDRKVNYPLRSVWLLSVIFVSEVNEVILFLNFTPLLSGVSGCIVAVCIGITIYVYDS